MLCGQLGSLDMVRYASIMRDMIVLSSDDEDDEGLCPSTQGPYDFLPLCPITAKSWFSTDHITLWAEHLNSSNAAAGKGIVFCAARPLPDKQQDMAVSLKRFVADRNSSRVYVLPFAHRSHFFLVALRAGSVRWFLDSMTMSASLSAFQRASVRRIQQALNGLSPGEVVVGAAAWQQLTGLGATVQPEVQDAGAGDGYNCGAFCCKYMWEILHSQPWPHGGVAEFRQHVATLLNCWEPPPAA